MIALGIGWESAARLFAPTPIDFAAAIPIAALGLVVNVASAWLLSREGAIITTTITAATGTFTTKPSGSKSPGLNYELSMFEQGVPPRFRLAGPKLSAATTHVETTRPDGARQRFAMRDRGGFLESIDEIPEPHQFEVWSGPASASPRAVSRSTRTAAARLHRDHNMRAAVMHVMADAAVSVLVIVGLTLAKMFGWLWMDPLRAWSARR